MTEHALEVLEQAASDPLLTTGEVGELLGLSSEAVLRRWRAGELPGFRLSTKVLRFRYSEVLTWLEEHRIQTRASTTLSPVAERLRRAG